MDDWPRTKPEQERAAAAAFAETLEVQTGRGLEHIRSLPDEADFDIEAWEAGTRIQIEVTELVTRDVVRDYGGGQLGYAVDDLRDLLVETIAPKLPRYPQRGVGHLMLLVYSVDVAALDFAEGERTNSIGERELVVPDALLRAREHVVQQSANPFQEVWYVAPTSAFGIISRVYP